MRSAGAPGGGHAATEGCLSKIKFSREHLYIFSKSWAFFKAESMPDTNLFTDLIYFYSFGRYKIRNLTFWMTLIFSSMSPATRQK